MASVAQLWRFPVKSMQGAPFDGGELGKDGFEGDRRWAVVDVESGKVLSAKTVGELLLASASLSSDGGVVVTLPDGSSLEGGSAAGDELLSAWLGRPVRLERASVDVARTYRMQFPDPTNPDEEWHEFPCPPGTYFDAAPVHLLSEASLGSWDIRRFRPTVLVTGTGSLSGYPEDEWNRFDIAVGGAVIRSLLLTPRCAMPMRAQPEGIERDKSVVQSLKAEHQLNLGLYCWVMSPGPVRVGDEVAALAPVS